MQCEACGAPISEDPVRGFATCKYCGTKNRMPGGTVQMPAPVPQQQQQPRSPDLDALRRARERIAFAPQTPRSKSSRLVIVGIVLLAGGIPATLIGLGIAGDLGVRTFATAEPCRALINDDAVPDFIGVGYKGDEQHLIAIDGADGSTLWVGDWMEGARKLFCGDATTVLVPGGGFALAGVDTRTGARRWTARLSDHVSAVGAAPSGGCAVAKLADNSLVGVSLATGRPMACPSAGPPVPGDSDDDRYTSWRSAEGAGLRFTITARPRGTPILTVSATDATGATRWTVPLEAKAFGDDEGGFVGFAADRVVTVGASLADKDHFVTTTLDPASGRVLGRLEETEDDSTWHDAGSNPNIWLFGNRLYTHGFVALACHDVTTLDKVWDVGM